MTTLLALLTLGSLVTTTAGLHESLCAAWRRFTGRRRPGRALEYGTLALAALILATPLPEDFYASLQVGFALLIGACAGLLLRASVTRARRHAALIKHSPRPTRIIHLCNSVGRQAALGACALSTGGACWAALGCWIQARCWADLAQVWPMALVGVLVARLLGSVWWPSRSIRRSDPPRARMFQVGSHVDPKASVDHNRPGRGSARRRARPAVVLAAAICGQSAAVTAGAGLRGALNTLGGATALVAPMRWVAISAGLMLVTVAITALWPRAT